MSDSLEPTVLAADDSPLQRKLIEKSLSAEPCALMFATNGQKAIELFGKYRPALLITDWRMPDISGPELCQRVRQTFPEQYPYIILLTGQTEKEQVIEGLSAGADDYLTKPFHPGELQARVRAGLRIADLHRQLLDKNHELQQMALTDGLTGLPNRRAVDGWAKHQVSAAARHKFPVWVVMADLDHFKGVNDTYGHEMGDTVLKSFAEIVRSNTRLSNMCGRLGGEEFIAIITHVEEHDKVLIPIERIRTELEKTRFEFPGGHFHCTASFGIAGTSGRESFCFEQLLSHADKALYQAKHRGRNCIEFATD
ncbi:MAG TPA: diguanylate cyclase [Terriglobales bacterium]|nr:diguanylate cyclase [Terriglobales bacterium]